MTLTDYISHYRAQGLKPIPLHSLKSSACTCPKGAECTSAGKHPRVNRRDAINATEAIWDAWLSQWPNMNIGILTGADTGIFAVDIDPRHGGDAALSALFTQYGEFPATASATTGGGGTHYLFKIPPGLIIQNSAGTIGEGIDIRGNGGLIVVAPSKTKGAYKWN